ncbi:MAG: hypothetical protein ACLSG8_12540 [Barnesiella sp.]
MIFILVLMVSSRLKRDLDDMVREGGDRIVLETDAPYLAHYHFGENGTKVPLPLWLKAGGDF